MTGSILSRALKGILLVFGTVVAIFLISYLLPPSRLQKQSLAALQAAPAQPGRNAYVALATVGMQGLSLEQRKAKATEFVTRFNAWELRHRHDTEAAAASPRDPLPVLQSSPPASTAQQTELCSLGDATGCLEQVRARPQAVAKALQAQAEVLTQIAELSDYGHYRSPLAPSLAAPLPSIRILATPLAAHVQTYLQGDPQAALGGLCRDATSGRMLMTQSDSLLITMAGAAMLSANTQVLASLLSELPTDTPLPAQCKTALALLQPQEMSICNAMRGEFRMNAALNDNQTAQRMQQAQAWMFFNAGKTKARTAEFMATACLPAAQTALTEDRPQPPAPQPSMWRMECAANYIGCVLSAIAAPTYNDYANRLQDVGARLRLLQAGLWLREQANRAPGQAPGIDLRDLPAQLQQGPRKIRLSTDGRALQLTAYSKRDSGKPLTLPLPQALLAPSAAVTAR